MSENNAIMFILAWDIYICSDRWDHYPQRVKKWDRLSLLRFQVSYVIAKHSDGFNTGAVEITYLNPTFDQGRADVADAGPT